jgi:hypothetical protein
MEELLEVGHAGFDLGVRWRHEDGVARPGPTEPVLRATELAWKLPAAASSREQHFVDLPNETVGQRETTSESTEAVLERRNVVRDLGHVIDGDTGRLIELEEEEIQQRRLSPLDL